MLHKLVQIDGAHWQIDDYEIVWKWVDGEFAGMFYMGINLMGEQVTDTYTTFEDCLGELIWYIEDVNSKD